MGEGSGAASGRRAAIADAWHSIRTRYAVATVCFMMFVLAVFYAGGRVVLVHLVRDAETQMRSVGLDLSRAAARGTAPTEPLAARAEDGDMAWNLDDRPMQAVYAVRDAAGNLVSTVAVKIPNKLAGFTRAALFKLGFFIAVAGILLVLLLFFLQSRLLLDPLSRMTRKVSEIGAESGAADCPRLEWKGKDEFAQLAVSVNRMLETISRRSLAVAQAEARHRELINSLPDELLVFGSDGRFVSVLKDSDGIGQLPGMYPGELPAAVVYGTETVERFKAAVGTTIRTGAVGKLRLCVQRPLGASKSLATRHFMLRIVRIDEYFVLAMAADVTEDVNEHNRLRMIEARNSDSKKRESLTLLAASIAHDMNNVLSVVLNAAECDGVQGDSAKALATIRDAVRRGAGMMRELREYAGESRMALHRMKVHVIVDDIRILAEHVLPRSVLVTYDVMNCTPDVDADPGQFWKVIFNIVKNAGEAIGADRPGHIIIGCQPFEMTLEQSAKFISEKPLPPGFGTVLSIRDDGPGIAADILPRLFDPYVSSRSVGRGLGLATVRTIVEAHGGGIRVSSGEMGGTLFEIYLPESRLAEEAEQSAGAHGAVAGNNRREVLVVDDDALILRTTSIILKSLKFVPHVAKDAAEAMAIVRRHADDLRAIVLDANLGNVDSVRLLGACRVSAPSVPVIVSTGSAEDRIREQFATCPYDHFLSKPYTIDELKRVLA